MIRGDFNDTLNPLTMMSDSFDHPRCSKGWQFSNELDKRPNAKQSSFFKPRSGKIVGYFSLAHFENGNLSVGHLVGRTCKPLIKDQVYNISLYVNCYSKGLRFNKIELFFSADTLHFIHRKQTNKQKLKAISRMSSSWKPLLSSATAYFNPDHKGYQEVHFTYTAKGGEDIFYIGNLSLDLKDVKIKKLRGNEQVTLYVDDVSVLSEDSLEECFKHDHYIDSFENRGKIKSLILKSEDSILEKHTSAVKPDTLVLGKLNFENNSYKLNQEEKTKLEKLLSKYDFNNSSLIQINGHTDSVGNENDNLNLSYKRAEHISSIVKQYSNDCSIHVIGYGESSPVSVKRNENRRVEILIYRK